MSAQGFGLFDPAQEKDSCGVGFIADIKGRKSHKIVEDALTILLNLEHRGAVGADPRAGDGAGILVQTPHKFLAKKVRELGFALPAPGHYGVGALFLPHDAEWRTEIMDTYAAAAAQEGMELLGWRDVPTDNSTLGETVKPTEPKHVQVFLARGGKIASEDEFERRLYVLRKTISRALYSRRSYKPHGPKAGGKSAYPGPTTSRLRLFRAGSGPQHGAGCKCAERMIRAMPARPCASLRSGAERIVRPIRLACASAPRRRFPPDEFCQRQHGAGRTCDPRRLGRGQPRLRARLWQ